MGTEHSHTPKPAPPRVRRLVAILVLPLFAATVIAAVVLWPRNVPEPDTGGGPERRFGQVVSIVEEVCQETPDLPEGLPTGPCGTVTVRITEGADRGIEVPTPLPAGPGLPKVSVGDEVVLMVLNAADTTETVEYNIADQQRGEPLIWVGVAFALAIIGFGRWRGLAALAGLAASFAILLTFVLPGIQVGKPPLLVAVVGAALIMFVVLYLTHGLTVQTSVAVLGTLASLILTGILGTVVTGAAHLTGFGSEEATTLSVFQESLDLHGLLLAGIIIGSLGVLDDVTVTQAATVSELGYANPSLTRLQLYRSATRVGRAHIASTVNTIVLAYAGASLPVLLLIVGSGQAVSETLTSEFIAQEIVRSAVATLGLIAAVPITTALAAVVTAGPAARKERVAAKRRRPDRSDTLTALAERPRHGAWE
ncbi:YibE/F family protein [Spirilliplanes yamanashiensis]|uniref:YibE/F family protein n=1 Tax=Spirilliplanes yamanashiensis TaxID=42233 RepID=A0A8J3YDK1_9ACTN|nr:YibE/F family protein [Spirilliplanes yamanashiensis]MDP9818428.1 putative membrane protein [Spirilliplanes yamanashiensis]GIJ06648.1 hypothetical protein Sya03_60000 [Spirilliplanes yamanashiensis]